MNTTIREQIISELNRLKGTHGALTKLCRHCGLSQSYVTLLRQGKRTPSLDTAEKLLAYMRQLNAN